MCTLSLSDIGELRDDWLRLPRAIAPMATPGTGSDASTVAVPAIRAGAAAPSDLHPAAAAAVAS